MRAFHMAQALPCSLGATWPRGQLFDHMNVRRGVAISRRPAICLPSFFIRASPLADLFNFNIN
jgi:hypothetical protein